MVIQDEPILDFRFAVIDLARLDAQKYVRQANAAAMALSARMMADPHAKVSFTADFIHNTVLADWMPIEKEAVYRFFFAYQELTDEEGLKLKMKLGTMRGMWTPPKFLRNTPLEQMGRAVGRREGRKEGEIRLVLQLLNRRLGPVSRRHRQALRELSLRRIEALAKALLDFQTSDDLRSWLKSHSS